MTDKKLAVVTGGAGFVGSHLCERLIKEDCKVISLDNYFSGSKNNHIEGVDYREGHTKDIQKHIPEIADVIFHLGEYSRVAPSLEEPDVVWDLNMQGTHKVMEYWRKHRPKLIYAGSSTRFAEDRSDGVLGKDRAPYSWGKAANTDYIHNYGRWYDLPYSVAYFYNVYGPGERAGQFDGAYGTVVETFKQCVKNNQPAHINGEGTQTRAFTHVLDTIDALMLLAEKGERDEYAISAKEVYSLNELADLYGLEKQHKPATKTTRSSGASDTSKLEALGWSQKHFIDQYIAETKDNN